MNEKIKLKFFDYSILSIFIALTSIGIIMIYSSSSIVSSHLYGDDLYFLKRQIVWVILGIISMYIFYSIPLKYIREATPYIMLASLILLILVLIPGIGHEINGAKRWFKVGPLTIQASEFAKLALILFWAYFFSKEAKAYFSFKNFLIAFLITLIYIFLIAIEPHFSTAFLCLITFFAVVYIAGIPTKYIYTTFTIGLIISIFLIVSYPYRLKRIIAFINPSKHKTSTAYQIIQSLTAIGSGGFWGRGIGMSRQKFMYLPQSYNDFLFSILAEEFGFVGSVFVILLFIGLIWRGYFISIKSENIYNALLVTGIVVMIGFQAFFNIGVTLKVFPPTGIPLPFLSYGGSSFVIFSSMIGIILRVSKEEFII